MREGRVCTRCDPATCGKCRNTPERRQKLKRAAEAKAAAEQEAREKADREAQAKRKKLLDSLGATPKSARVPSTPQTSSTADPSNGLSGDKDAEENTSAFNESPPDETNVKSKPSQDDADKTTPPVSNDGQQQHRAEEEDSRTGGGDGGGQSNSDSARDNPTVASAEEGTTTSGTQQTQKGSSGKTNADGRQPPARKVRNTPPTEPRLSPHTGAPDAGSIGRNAIFNAKEQLGPWDVGYRVMEDDPKLQTLSRADELLIEVYGDTIHQNDGTHLDGGVADDRIWQRRWMKVVSCNLSLWDAPMGRVGKRFVQLLAEEWKGVRERQWNAERPIVCCAAILSRKRNKIRATTIRDTIDARIDLWEAGCFDELVEEVLITGRSGVAGRNSDSWKVAKRYNSMVLDGKIRGAVRFATGCGLGGPKLPLDKCSKMGETVIEVL
jgi:hypothetical protein